MHSLHGMYESYPGRIGKVRSFCSPVSASITVAISLLVWGEERNSFLQDVLKTSCLACLVVW
jgi:hypothetical protein